MDRLSLNFHEFMKIKLDTIESPQTNKQLERRASSNMFRLNSLQHQDQDDIQVRKSTLQNIFPPINQNKKSQITTISIINQEPSLITERKDQDLRVTKIQIKHSYPNIASFNYDERLFILHQAKVTKSQKAKPKKPLAYLNKTKIKSFSQTTIPRQLLIKEFLDKRFHRGDLHLNMKNTISEKIQIQTIHFHEILLNDKDLQHFFLDHLDKLKQVHVNLLGLAYDSQSIYPVEYLRKIHANIPITKDQFSKFKALLLKQMILMDATYESIYKAAYQIENYRKPILQKLPIWEALGGESGMTQLTLSMYNKIFADFTLAKNFKSANLSAQANKFARIMTQILLTLDTPKFIMEDLRAKHEYLQLNHIHFSRFKYHLAKSLLEQNADQDSIQQILEQFDSFKSVIINEDSIKDLIDQYYGYDNFLLEYTKQCQQQKNSTFYKHSKLMFHYFFNKQQMSLNLDDISFIHCPHANANGNLLTIMKRKAFYMIEKMNPHKVIFQDFQEDWEQCEQRILGHQLDELDEFVEVFYEQIRESALFIKLYKENDVDMKANLIRKFRFIVSGRKYFKISDIKVIHSELGISEVMFDDFVDIIASSIEKYDKDIEWLLPMVQQWKQVIVS